MKLELGRRTFMALAAAGIPGGLVRATPPHRQFFSAFVPGSLGVRADQSQAIELAAKYGFESVQPFPDQLARHGVQRYVDALRRHGIRWAAAGLPVEFRGDQPAFDDGMASLPLAAAALREAGADRVGTWLSPASDSLTYVQNFRRTASRLRRVAEVLQDHGLRLGLEYVGTQRNWTARRHSFVHTMAGTKDLIAEIGLSNVGFVLDSWHWWTSRESGDDIRTLANHDIVSADLNDAPVGIPRDEQYDNQRELPLATGVIDIREFLLALVDVGYDGPIRAEPFNRRLNDMEDGPACRITGESMRKAFELVG